MLPYMTTYEYPKSALSKCDIGNIIYKISILYNALILKTVAVMNDYLKL